MHSGHQPGDPGPCPAPHPYRGRGSRGSPALNTDTLHGGRARPTLNSGTPRHFRLDQLVVGPGVPLSDAQWAWIEPLLPDRTPKRGGRWRDHREVIDAIAFKFQTRPQWVYLPEKYGNWRRPQPAADVGRRRHLGAGVHRADGPSRHGGGGQRG
ncbi:transposase [Streptomyces sp. NPDC020800]|uniref:transposase n=1 Tax=Streptomyces sp. NPDC020800 TaxID=3365092 RepID=UPI003795A6D2